MLNLLLLIFLYILVVISLVYLYFLMKKLKTEIGYLPQIGQKIKSKFKGLNITNSLKLPDYLKHKPSIVMIVSSTCYPCHIQLEEFTNKYLKYKNRFVCFTTNEDQLTYNSILNKYEKYFTIYPLSKELVDRLNITAFPTILLLNSDGVVIDEGISIKHIVNHYKKVS